MNLTQRFSLFPVLALSALASSCAIQPPAMTEATSASVTLNRISDQGVQEAIGSVALSDGPEGVVIVTNLSGLPPGPHGFHVHQKPDCGPAEKDGRITAGEAAGEHYDPAGTQRHAGPGGAGHEGDLPRLIVASDGTVTGTLTVPRLTVSEMKNRSLMLHAGADDYGASAGGARIACGVVP